MNGHIGKTTLILDPSLRQYTKPGEIERPSPSSVFLLMDEHEDSINDGHFFVGGQLARSLGWNDVPANHHRKGTILSFADGHAESHRWTDPRTLFPITRNRLNFINQSGNRDIDWLHDHASAPK